MMALFVVVTLAALLALVGTNVYHKNRSQIHAWAADEWKQRAAFVSRLLTDVELENARLTAELIKFGSVEPSPQAPIVVPAGGQVH